MEEVADQAVHAVRLDDDVVRQRLGASRRRVVFDHFGGGSDRGQWAPQLMRGVGGELALSMVAALKPVEHPIHDRGEIADLVFARRYGHSLIEAGRRDRIDAF